MRIFDICINYLKDVSYKTYPFVKYSRYNLSFLTSLSALSCSLFFAMSWRALECLMKCPRTPAIVTYRYGLLPSISEQMRLFSLEY